MTTPTVHDMNEVIAVFEGRNYTELTSTVKWSKKEGEFSRERKSTELKYHTDYNWLISAWVKFRDLEFEDKETDAQHVNYCVEVSTAMTYENIEVAHKALYDAIVWYNSIINSLKK